MILSSGFSEHPAGLSPDGRWVRFWLQRDRAQGGVRPTCAQVWSQATGFHQRRNAATLVSGRWRNLLSRRRPDDSRRGEDGIGPSSARSACRSFRGRIRERHVSIYRVRRNTGRGAFPDAPACRWRACDAGDHRRPQLVRRAETARAHRPLRKMRRHEEPANALVRAPEFVLRYVSTNG